MNLLLRQELIVIVLLMHVMGVIVAALHLAYLHVLIGAAAIPLEMIVVVVKHLVAEVVTLRARFTAKTDCFLNNK